jgi:hypothetical protein
MKADEYVGMTLEQVIKELGVPDYISEKFIDNRYLPTPIEPIYAAYFSRSELEQGVTITVARWILIKNNTSVVIWLKNNNNEWIIFSSLRYQRKENKQIG